jgi:hypothetical protein
MPLCSYQSSLHEKGKSNKIGEKVE